MLDIPRLPSAASIDGPKEGAGRRPRGDVRAQILKVATRLLAAHGFEGTTLQAVADEVGIRKPSVLHHFPSKEALHDGVINDILEHWNKLVPQIMRSATCANRFDALTRELIGFFTEDRDRARVLVRETLDRPREFRELFLEHVLPWLMLIGSGVREGQRRGDYRPEVDPEEYLLKILQLIIVSIATGEVLAQPSSEEPREKLERQLGELLRIARTSLFVVDPEPTASNASGAPTPPTRQRKGRS